MHSDVSHLVEQVLRQRMAPAEIAEVDVRSGRDQDGEEALFVTVVLGPDAAGTAGATLLTAQTAVSHALLGIGEQRFPYVQIRRKGEPSAIEETISSGLSQ